MRALVKELRLEQPTYLRCGNSTGVLREVSRQVNALRERKHQKNLWLIVVIDADNNGQEGRLKELGREGRVRELEALVKTATADGARGAAERISFVVPAYAIETWYVHLCCPEARPVDETRDYKATLEWRHLEKDLGAAARRAAQAWRSEPQRADPDSLKAAHTEIERVR